MRTLPYALAAVVFAGSGAALLCADEPPAPVPAPAPEQVEEAQILKWISDLTSDDFRTREAASKHLAAAGESARAALETAAKASDSLEVRWRAEQLLMRLDSPGARPLGKAGEPGAGQPRTDADVERLREQWERQMREMMERLFRDFRGRDEKRTPFGPGAEDPFAAFGPTLRAGDVTLTLPFFAQGTLRLTVRGKDGTTTSHTGKSLEEILAAHPELKDVPGMADLERQVAERKQRGDALRQGLGLGGMPGTAFRMQRNGVEVRQDAGGALVRITETGEDGKPKTTEYTGATLDEIKQKHPEIAKHIDGVRSSFRIDVGPRFFRGPRDNGLAPLLPPAPPITPAKPEGTLFGIGLGTVEPVLALHLGLENGRGVLVEFVEPGSQAALLGLERYDVIESIDGAPVLAFEQARQILRAAAREKAPLTLGIIRTGKRQTLSR